MSDNLDRSILFAKSKQRYNKTKVFDPVIIVYTIPNLLDIFQNDSINSCVFPKYDDAFAEFVFNNRLQSDGWSHSFDFIYGVQTDSKPLLSMMAYNNGDISKDDVLSDFKIPTSSKQLCIRSQAFCDQLVIDKVLLDVDC